MSKIDYFDDEYIMPHKKKAKKTVKKSNHKHLYEDCLLLCNKTLYHAERCPICGKVGNYKIFETEPTERGYLRVLSSSELYQKYKHLKIYDSKTGEEVHGYKG